MKLLFTLLLALSTARALPAETPKAKPAVPAQPAKPKASTGKGKAIIGSDMDGRELAFVSSALDLGKTHQYLTTVATRTENTTLRTAGKNLVEALRNQGVVLDSIAEMRKLKAAEGASASQQKWEQKLEKLQGPRLEKTVLDALIDTDRQLIAAYEAGAKSSDEAIRNLVEQSLPPLRKHLELLEGMAGIGSKDGTSSAKAKPAPIGEAITKATEPAPPKPADPAPNAAPPAPAPAPKKPAFRTNIPLPEG